MSKKIFIVLIVLVTLIFLFLGFLGGRSSEKRVCQEEISRVREEKNKLNSLLAICYPPLPEEIYEISGRITKIEDKNLWLEARVRVSQFPLPEGKEIEKQNIKVSITDKTKIFKREFAPIQPTPEKSPSIEELFSVEALFKEIILKFGDLKVGDEITVISKENIKGKKEIVASEIRLGP